MTRPLLYSLAVGLGIASIGAWHGSPAEAQTSLCFERCAFTYGWPDDQCRRYCRRADSQTRVYGYTRRIEQPGGGCGTFRYWDGSECRDARDGPPR